ncbi:hypothetical protein V8C42DRAFT_142185 [Trichoderma barbatum]
MVQRGKKKKKEPQMVSCSDAGGNELRLAALLRAVGHKRSQAACRRYAIMAGFQGAGPRVRVSSTRACRGARRKASVQVQVQGGRAETPVIDQSMRYRPGMMLLGRILPHGAGREWWLVMRATVLRCVVHYGVHESSHACEARSVSSPCIGCMSHHAASSLFCSLDQRHPYIHDTCMCMYSYILVHVAYAPPKRGDGRRRWHWRQKLQFIQYVCGSARCSWD